MPRVELVLVCLLGAGCGASLAVPGGNRDLGGAVDAEPDLPAVCGDTRCTGAESCQSCPDDCGECPTCNFAPSCTDAVGLPAKVTPRADLSIGAGAVPGPGVEYGPGADACDKPQLRLRVSKIKVRKGGGKLYCVVTATDGLSSEVALTAETRSLGDGDEHFFDPTVGVFWGQMALRPTTNNLAITYNCFVVKSDAWSSVLKAAGDAAILAGGVAGVYGWAFGIAGVAANVAAAAVKASAGNELRLNAQQVIAKKELLDLTNGRYWTVQKKDDGGAFGIGAWDWTLTVEAWGCANRRPFPN